MPHQLGSEQQQRLAAFYGCQGPPKGLGELLWLEGLTAGEIESVTGVKAATVAVRLSRVRKELALREVKHA